MSSASAGRRIEGGVSASVASTSASSQPRKNLQTYIWDGPGPLARREGKQLVVYERNDLIELTAEAAFHVRGSLKSVGGLILPPDVFDGKSHPIIETPKPSSPHLRARMAGAVGMTLDGVPADGANEDSSAGDS